MPIARQTMPARIASSASGALPQGAGGRWSADGARGGAAEARREGVAALVLAAAAFGAGGLRGRPRRFDFFALLPLNGRQPPG
jgi:hypothetical protein